MKKDNCHIIDGVVLCSNPFNGPKKCYFSSFTSTYTKKTSEKCIFYLNGRCCNAICNNKNVTSNIVIQQMSI